MPLTDVDLARRRSSVGLPSDQVDIILYLYNEQSFDEQHFTSVHRLLKLFDNTNEDVVSEVPLEDSTCRWIEVINNSSQSLPKSVELLCDYFELHSLTTEDISTLAPTMKLDLFNDNSAIYLLMKMIQWNGTNVEQQQISFYLKSSQNLLITFQEKSTQKDSFFESIRQRLRREQHDDVNSMQMHHPHNRLRKLHVDYLFYCLLDAIIDRYMLVLDDISTCIDRLDEELMMDGRSRTLSTLHSIYRLKHDLLHLRILFNPLLDIIFRLQRTESDDQGILPIRHVESILRLGIKHRIIRRQPRMARRVPPSAWIIRSNSSNTGTTSSSLFLHEYLYVYLNDMSDHVIQLIDTLEMHRETVSNLVSFSVALNSNQVRETLKLLALITITIMPCSLLVGINSTNYKHQPQLKYEYGYYIVLGLLAIIAIGMITWYKIKRWI